MYDLLRLQKPLYRYGSTTANPAGHFASGLMYLNGYNASDAEPKGFHNSNDYRFLCQISELEMANLYSVLLFPCIISCNIATFSFSAFSRRSYNSITFSKELSVGL